jgi:hypothetical protein
MNNTATRLKALVVFGAEFKPDPRGAAAALRAAGYEVVMMPEQCRKLLLYKRDDFLEALVEMPSGGNVELFVGAKYEKAFVGAEDKILHRMMEAVRAIVDPFGGDCMEAELIAAGEDYVPFSSIGLAQHYEKTKTEAKGA